MKTLRRWWKLALVIAALLAAVQIGVSFLVRTRRMHQYLSTHLERAFGRPVEVGHFAVQLFPSPRLDAEEVTVGEDPAFGNEYFLRSEHLSAGLRWIGLLRGHFEFGTLSLGRPSLILVRDGEGKWNLERWLPPSKSGDAVNSRIYGPPAAIAPVNRLQRIEFDDGRINFKNADDKLPFALIGVSGSVEQVSPGRWQLRLEAQPWRSGVTLQSTGTLFVQGDIAGTSARLQPAEINMHWGEVSLADLFRLLWGQDYGVRGAFSLDGTAKSGASPPSAPSGHGLDVEAKPAAELAARQWTFALRARAEQIHRWDLTERSDNPQLGVTISGHWDVAAGSVRAEEVSIEAPLSNVRGTASFASHPDPGFELNLDSAGIQAADLLAWYRAFNPDVAEGISVRQFFTGAMTLRGWPLQLGEAAFSSKGGSVTVPGLNEPLRIGAVRGGSVNSKLEVEAVRISFPGDRGLQSAPARAAVAGSRQRAAGEIANSLDLGFTHDFESGAGSVSLDGRVEQVEHVLKVAAAFGRPRNHGWELTGAASAALRWSWNGAPLRGRWDGQLDVSKARLQAAGLNRPLSLDAAKLIWMDGKRTAEISKAEGFGATWSGSIAEERAPGDLSEAKWKFLLHADQLDATELDRWVGPRARPSWLQRLLPSLLGGAAPGPAASELVRRVNAEGELSIDEFTVEKLKLEQVHAQGSLHDLQLDVREAEAEWAGGKLQAELHATFAPHPKYDVTAKLDKVKLLEIPAAERLAGLVSGTLHLATEGVGRDELLQKLVGSGEVRLKNVEFRGWDVNASVADGEPHTGVSRWKSGKGSFTMRNRNVLLEALTLESGREQTSVQGTVSFGREADLTIRNASAGKREERKIGARPRGESGGSPRVLKISGPLDVPRVSVERAAIPQPAD